MPIDPKVRSSAGTPRPSTPSSVGRAAVPRADVTPATPATAMPAAVAVSAPGYSASSGFEADRSTNKTAEGRKVKGGVADDSIGVGDTAQGRKVRGGVADDSIGAGDTAQGRRVRGGVADDSIGIGDAALGRKVRGGVADDSIGLGDDALGRKPKGGVADDSIGRKVRGGVADDSIGFDAVREALVGPDKDPAHVAARDALYAKLETPSYLNEKAPTADGAKVSAAVTAALGRGGAALADLAKKDSTVAGRLAATLDATKNTAAATRNSLLQTLGAGAKNAISTVVQHVTQSATFGAMNADAQAKVATVLSKVGERGAKLFGALFEQNTQVLTDKDSAGRTGLDNLAQIAGQPLNAMLAGKTTTDEVLTNSLLDVTNPNRVEQGDAPTCTVASMQFELVGDEPSEYLRVIAGLTGPTGQVKLRQGGVLATEASDGDLNAREGRSVTQALFQTTCMEYANGRGADFDPIAGQSTDSTTNEVYRGLKPKQQSMVLRQLFGVNYETKTLYSQADGQKALDVLKGYDAAGAQNRPVILDIDQGSFNHAVTLEKVSDGRVYFRDPYGVLRSMTDDLFSKYVVAVHEPTDAQLS